MPVVRALQRKARVSTALVGDSELQSSMPLLGQRLRTATSALGRVDAHEKLRSALKRWLDLRFAATPDDAILTPLSLGLIDHGGHYRLVVAGQSGVTENPDAVLQAVEQLSPNFPSQPCPGDWTRAVAPILRWLDEQRGRELARLATDAPSAAHSSVLRALQELLQSATRTERTMLAPRIEQ
jgi:hypothetical protein